MHVYDVLLVFAWVYLQRKSCPSDTKQWYERGGYYNQYGQ